MITRNQVEEAMRKGELNYVELSRKKDKVDYRECVVDEIEKLIGTEMIPEWQREFDFNFTNSGSFWDCEIGVKVDKGNIVTGKNPEVYKRFIADLLKRFANDIWVELNLEDPSGKRDEQIENVEKRWGLL